VGQGTQKALIPAYGDGDEPDSDTFPVFARVAISDDHAPNFLPMHFFDVVLSFNWKRAAEATASLAEKPPLLSAKWVSDGSSQVELKFSQDVVCRSVPNCDGTAIIDVNEYRLPNVAEIAHTGQRGQTAASEPNFLDGLQYSIRTLRAGLAKFIEQNDDI
jgi:hypothetical protein